MVGDAAVKAVCSRQSDGEFRTPRQLCTTEEAACVMPHTYMPHTAVYTTIRKHVGELLDLYLYLSHAGTHLSLIHI